MSVQRAMADLANLDAEGQRLKAKLLDIDNRASKLRTYIEVSQEYGTAKATGDNQMPPDDQSTPINAKPPSDRGVTQRAVETSIELLEAKGGPLHTRDLLKMLAERGIVIRGGNPVANLSGFLSRDKARLRNSRTDGWSLSKWRMATTYDANEAERGVDGEPIDKE